MRLSALLVLLLACQAQAASDAIYLPNIPGNATGTTTGAKKGLDTYVSGGGGMQTEDAVHVSGDSGVLTLGVRNDAGVALAADGDYVPLTTDNTGALRVNATEVATVADGGALPGVVKVIGGYDGSNVQVIKTDASGELQVDVLSSALPTGAATSALQTSGAQKTQITDSSGNAVTIKDLSVQVASGDLGLVVNSVIHGLTTAGGGSYVDVKVTPSGALSVDATVSSSVLPTGAATSANQTTELGYIDGLETLIGTTNSSLTTLDGHVDGLETLVGTTNSTLTTIDGHVDGLETLVGTTNSSLATIATNTGQSPQNANVTDSTNQTVGVAAVTEAAPSDAVGFELSADPSNTGIVYYRLGGTATTSAGHPLEASRDTGFMPVKATISLIASAASQKYNLTWIRR